MSGQRRRLQRRLVTLAARDGANEHAISGRGPPATTDKRQTNTDTLTEKSTENHVPSTENRARYYLLILAPFGRATENVYVFSLDENNVHGTVA